MSDLTPQLPIWLTEKNVTALAKVAQSYWQEIESYLFWWLEQQHSENAQTAILDLLAWQPKQQPIYKMTKTRLISQT